MRLALLVGLAVCCGACETVSIAALDHEKFVITTGDLRENYSPTALVEARLWGLVVFGVIPLRPGTLQGACDLVVERAKRLGADAVIDLEYWICRPPFPISFFWWKRGATVRGTAVKRVETRDNLAP